MFKQKEIVKIIGNQSETVADFLSIEEPLQIQLEMGDLNDRQIKNISVTMRTPGNDEELAVGFLFTEGIVKNVDQFECDKNKIVDNNISLYLKPEYSISINQLDRNFYTSSSCGVCGKSSIDAIKTISNNKRNNNKTFSINANIIYQLPTAMKQAQSMFQSTGGIHASALFDLDGNLIALREDVGRHNALDKLIGYAFMNNLVPLSQHILLLSGRASFELIQKAAMAGIQVVVAIGAPSSLAVELAEEQDMTLIGFLKSDKMNVYCGEKRLLL